MQPLTKELIKNYDIEGPRYTSYPTAPVWTTAYTSITYGTILDQAKTASEPLSLYIHIPFCQKRCLYCACNVVIRKQKDSIGDDYISYLEKEMILIKNKLSHRPIIKQIHMGGGTPTFLTDDQLLTLKTMIETHFDISTVEETSIEVDPRTVSVSRIETLHKLGFNRLSFGIQDFDENVQTAIGRKQSYEDVQLLFDAARSVGFLSINCDLIYGLPLQTSNGFEATINKILRLKPDRIALYSFAYVPWVYSHQKILDAYTFPTADEKISLFLYAREQLLSHGYTSIAMDHFALKNDPLTVAYNENKLKRNFMGYTTLNTDHYLGLGVSSIGYMSKSFAQNTKDLKEYYAMLDAGQFPIKKGYILSEEDIINQWVITSLMCQFEIDKTKFQHKFNKNFDHYFESKKEFLKTCINGKLIEEKPNKLLITELGRLFVRNVCMGFDDYLPKDISENKFSRTV